MHRIYTTYLTSYTFIGNYTHTMARRNLSILCSIRLLFSTHFSTLEGLFLYNKVADLNSLAHYFNKPYNEVVPKKPSWPTYIY